MLRQGEKGGAAADKFAVRGLDPEPDRGGDPVAKAKARQILGRDPRQHQPVAPPVIIRRKFRGSAGADHPREIRRNSRILACGRERSRGPAVEDDMQKRRIQKRFFQRLNIQTLVIHDKITSGATVDKNPRLCYTTASCKLLQL